MKFNLFISSLAWLSVFSVATPTKGILGGNSITKRTPLWQFYYDVTSAQHQANFNQYSAAGYQIISLSVYGQPPNHRYAAVWVQRAGPSYYAIHEASGSAYQTFFDTHSKSGYVSTIITVTGPASSAIFAGVMEQNGVTNWYQKCGLTLDQYKTELSNAQANRYILKSFTEYNIPSNRLYCGIWYYNGQYDKYSSVPTQSYDEYQTLFNSETTKPFWRPYYLSVSEDHFVSSAFTDTDVGSWVARHGMSAAALQAEYETQKAVGLHIIHLQGGGTGANANFAALFADYDVPTPRSWRVTGTTTGFQNNAIAGPAADELMQNFMQANGVRQAQLSVGSGGQVLMEKGYSWSEATRHTTSPTDVFLLASISKAFLEACVQTLYNSGQLTPTTKVYPLLGYTSTPDPRLQMITVNQLLNHTGGLNRSATGFDVAYSMRLVSAVQNGNTAVANVKDVVDYMSKYHLDYDPGEGYAYSNYGYILLSYLVANVTRTDYYSYLSSSVLTPYGYDVRKWTTIQGDHANDPITQESEYTGLSALQPNTNNVVADIFGGDGQVKEDCYGEGALATSASTLVKFIDTHAVWGIGGRPILYGADQLLAREGSTPGANTWAESRGDGFDWAITVNTRDYAPRADGQDPFVDILCNVTMSAFLDANPML